MKISLPRHGNKYRLHPLVDNDQALYIEARARRERTNPHTIVWQAIDLMMCTEPLPITETDEVTETAASR